MTWARGGGVCTGSRGPRARVSPALELTDGGEATRQAWRRLFPRITLVLCFLAVLKSKDRCTGPVAAPGARQGLAGLSGGDHTTVRTAPAAPGRSASPAHLHGAVAEMVLKRCRRRADFRPACGVWPARRTSNGVDRLRDPKPGCSTPCAIVTAPSTAHAWQYAHGAAMERSPVWRAPAA